MLSLQELRVFLEAAATENFSEAGRRLGISQPAVSMQIKALETRLATELFHRSGRHVSLTDAGQALVPLARDLANRAISLEEEIASLHGEVVGLLKIACTTTAGKYVLPHLLAGLQERHPRVRVVCDVVPRSVALVQITDGESHVGMASMIEGRRILEFRPFLEDRITLVTRPDHPWALRGGPVQPEELLGERFIVREETSGTSVALTEGLGAHGITIPDLKPMMTLGNSEAIRMAVQEGLGIAFVSTMVAAEAAAAGTIAILDVEGLDVSKTLYLFRNPEEAATRAAMAFWEFAFAPEHEELRRRPSQVGVELG
jgi:DNA-binding transcriptional LysR family regulator